MDTSCRCVSYQRNGHQRNLDGSEHSFPTRRSSDLDAETGQEIWIDTFSKKVRNEYSKWWNTNQENITKIFNKSRTDTVSIATDEDFVPALLSLFKKRGN